MEFVIIAFFTALGKVLILSKLMGIVRLVKYQIALDIGFTFLMPLLFIGTFSGALIAVFSGLWFTCILWFLSLFVKVPVKPKKNRHA